MIVEEAGGAVTGVFGDPFSFDMKSGFLCAVPGLNAPIGALIQQA